MASPWISPLLAAVALAGLAVGSLDPAAAEAGGITSLRGSTAIPETSPAPAQEGEATSDGRLPRAYRQQPPLIPHSVEDYRIDLKENQCLMCHDWPNNTEANAPKISESHYVDRNGVVLGHVARNRWLCTQCHVPQADARALVDNTFKSSLEVE